MPVKKDDKFINTKDWKYMLVHLEDQSNVIHNAVVINTVGFHLYFQVPMFRLNSVAIVSKLIYLKKIQHEFTNDE